MVSAVVSFAAVAALLTITPGLDTMLVLRTALASGGRTAYLAALGVCTGAMSWGLATAAGVTALLSASRLGYDVLRVAGAGYLFWLGGRALWLARHPSDETHATPPRCGHPGRWTAYRTGLLTNLLNPKVGAFYLSLLPQFIPPSAPVFATTMLLASVHLAEGLVWFVVVVVAARQLRGWVGRPRVRRRLEQLCGLVFIGFGVRLAVEHG